MKDKERSDREGDGKKDEPSDKEYILKSMGKRVDLLNPFKYCSC